MHNLRVWAILIQKSYKEAAKNKLKHRKKNTKPADSSIGGGEAIIACVENM